MRLTRVGADPSPEISALVVIPGVAVTGSVPDVRPYVTKAALTVAPLRIARGTQNKILEAMAMGVPVVTTPISGIPEMIDDGVHGLLVDGSAQSLADAIGRVLGDDALHARLARAARARICERFDSRRTTTTLRDLFVQQLQAASDAADAARARRTAGAARGAAR